MTWHCFGRWMIVSVLLLVAASCLLLGLSFKHVQRQREQQAVRLTVLEERMRNRVFLRASEAARQLCEPPKYFIDCNSGDPMQPDGNCKEIDSGGEG